jgi:hypothetical protein
MKATIELSIPDAVQASGGADVAAWIECALMNVNMAALRASATMTLRDGGPDSDAIMMDGRLIGSIQLESAATA